MKRFLLLTCALALAGAAQADAPGTALTAQQISDQATAESRSLQIIERQPDGRVRMTAPMQAMEALIGPDGMELRSVDAGGDAAFGWRLEAVGRASSSQSIPPFFRRGARGDAREARAVADTGKVVIEGERVAVLRPQAKEEYTASADGIRQDFIIPHPPRSGEGELLLELQANGAQLQNLPDNNQAITLRMADGRELHYHALHVTDANGRELPARMHAHTETHLRITVDDTGAQYPIRVDPTFSDADWTAIIGLDFDGEINAVEIGGGDLYVGGGFSSSPGGQANFIARWDGSSWSALGGGTNGGVLALSWHAVSGHLYAGGYFTSAGGNPVNYVARWDGVLWSSLGSGMNSSVSALVWDEASGLLYAAGEFTSASGTSASRIARWNGNDWSALAGGVSGGDFPQVSALTWDAANGHLYVGGNFTSAGVEAAHNIARWDGADWSPLGIGMDSGVFALAWDPANEDLYAGGGFTSAGGNPANRIAHWNGAIWSPLEDGLGGSVAALAWDAVNGHLYAAGGFTSADGNPANRIARWDGISWSTLGSGLENWVHAMAWDETDGHLYVGGAFTSPNDGGASHIAHWDGGDWSALGGGMNGGVNALAWDVDNGHLYVGGSFTFVGGNSANYIARWDGSAWSPLEGGMNSLVFALAWDSAKGHLYAGGDFSQADGNPANHIARWDGSSWSSLSSGTDNPVRALAWDATSDDLYVGGSFTSAGGTPASNVARWDGSSWVALGNGIANSIWGVRALAWDDSNGHLYAGGGFMFASGVTTNGIARWDGAAWSGLGDGISGGSLPRVFALAWDAGNSHLYAGGDFTFAGGNPASRIARWDGSNWWALGSGTNDAVSALAWDAENRQLYAGGGFTSAGGQPARIARARIRQQTVFADDFEDRSD